MSTVFEARPAVASTWRPVAIGTGAIAAAERDAIGTTARVVAWPASHLGTALGAVDAEIARLDREASRFRHDSDLSRLNRAGEGVYLLSAGLAEAIGVALFAARWTDGLADPTIGEAVLAAGYDRDFAALEVAGEAADAAADAATGAGEAADEAGGEPPGAGVRAPGWRTIGLDGRFCRMPAGLRLDLGATAKALGADRSAAAAARAMGGDGGVLVSLGGDLAVAGRPPTGGWPVLATDSHPAGSDELGQQVRLGAGALATSSTTRRRWRRAGRVLHHVIDPRTGAPAGGPWRTASVAASSCVDANAASTAAIVAGSDAEAWLEANGLAARLVAGDGTVVLVGDWPETPGGAMVPRGPVRCRPVGSVEPALSPGGAR